MKVVQHQAEKRNRVSVLRHTLEGINELLVTQAYTLDEESKEQITSETGIPAGWFPLVFGYDRLPEFPTELELPPLAEELLENLAKHKRINPGDNELTKIKNNLWVLYEAGPGAKDTEQEEVLAEDNAEVPVAGAYIPIPTETFLEELSVKLKIHPISVYWLLEELRLEGARCKPEEKWLLEDRLTVLVLHLMGHRWPKQLEAGEPLPDWADKDGILTMIQGAGGHEEKTLVEQVRERLRAEEGPLGAQQTEALLAELTWQSLEDWLRKTFFPRHVRQFKSRPIAWHLASQPDGAGKKKGGTKRPAAFECLLYYHVCGGDALARIRTQYVEPLIRAERSNLSAARQNKNETTAAVAGDRLRELEEFADKLRQVEESGFETPELEKLLAGEPLDRWNGDGSLAPASRDELWQQERSWRVDINDGVRVNIAPLQLAGLLAGDVLKAPDAKKALADRARWRSDERRWVRDGKLPRCGWMGEDVPESPAWTRLAPQRAAEQQKLELKRKAALEKVQ